MLAGQPNNNGATDSPISNIRTTKMHYTTTTIMTIMTIAVVGLITTEIVVTVVR